MKRLLLGLVMHGLLVGMSSTALAAGPLMSPAGIAYLKAEQNRIDRQFIDRAASVAAVPESVVRDAMPRGPRITDTGRRVIHAIERHLGGPLDETQRARIQLADERRKAALSRAREAAVQR